MFHPFKEKLNLPSGSIELKNTLIGPGALRKIRDEQRPSYEKKRVRLAEKAATDTTKAAAKAASKSGSTRATQAVGQAELKRARDDGYEAGLAAGRLEKSEEFRQLQTKQYDGMYNLVKEVVASKATQ